MVLPKKRGTNRRPLTVDEVAYPDPGRPGVWRVPVTSAKHPGLEALIDAADEPLVRGKRWNWSPGKPGGGINGSVVIAANQSPKPSLARLLLNVTTPDQQVCFLNGDRLDCRRANLVLKTRSEVSKARKTPEATLARFRPYPVPDLPGVFRVPVRSRLQRREALIDAKDLPVVQGKNWNWATRGDGSGTGTVVLATTGRQTPLHRMILGTIDRAARVGFANGDPLDCRRENLLVRTQSEVNRAGRPMTARGGKTCTSRFKGVSWDAQRQQWVVQIRKGNTYRQFRLGCDEEAAAQAYDDCVRVWFGEHAYVNFPDRETIEPARTWAERILDGSAARARRRAVRRRKLERRLRRAAFVARQVERERTAAERDAARAAEAEIPKIGRHAARRLFGVSLNVWYRWERLGWITCGRRVDGKKMYPIAEIDRLLQASGRLRPPYPDPYRSGVWRVPLFGRRMRRIEALIDAASLPIIKGARCCLGNPQIDGKFVSAWFPATRQHVPLRRLITGASDSGQQVGHRNGDPLDCRLDNLLVLSVAERSQTNRKIKLIKGRPPTSQFKGVYWETQTGKWRAAISSGDVHKRLGRFHSETEAAEAYDRAARELFGPHAYLNFPDGIQAWSEARAA